MCSLTGNDGAGHPHSTRVDLSSLSPDAHQHIGDGFKFGPEKLIGCVMKVGSTASRLIPACAAG